MTMLRVMLIDDEPSVLVGLRLLLDWSEHDAEICGCFQHPDDALDAAPGLQPDLIITDIEMPEISGLDLIVSLQTVCPWATCVILSAYSDFRYAQRAVELGVYRYLLKPLAADTLAALLRDTKNRQISFKPVEHAYLRMHMIKEMLLHGTEFYHAETIPSLQNPLHETDFQLLFLKPPAELSLTDLQLQIQEQYPIVAAFQQDGELLLLLDATFPEEQLAALRQQYAACVIACSAVFSGLPAGHQIILDRKAVPDSEETEETDGSIPLGNSQQAVQKAMAYIQEHYMEHDFRLTNVSEALYLNNSYLSHIFKQKTGTTLYQYLLDIRMQEAKDLLRNSNMTVAEIGYQVGYAIPKNFYSAFKKYYSESPRSYQKRKFHND